MVNTGQSQEYYKLDLINAIANYAASKADKQTISRKLNQAIGIIAKSYDVPEDQIKQLKAEAKRLLGLFPAEDKANG